jgi:hypothetical protein
MKSFRLWAMSALTLVTVGWLQADTLPVDPTIKFKTGGGGSTDITCNVNGCTTTLTPAIGADGQAVLDIFNKAEIVNADLSTTPLNIIAMTFFIPTANFNQDFTAITDAFTGALILPDEAHNQLEVLFFGVGGSGPGGSAFVPADISAPPGSPGFIAGDFVTVQTFFSTTTPGSGLQGLPFGKEGVLTLTTVPEPGMFWASLIGVAGLLVTRRRVRSK